MAKQVLRLIFGGFNQDFIHAEAGSSPSRWKHSLASFLENARESPFLYVNLTRHEEDTLSSRWERAEHFIEAFLKTAPPATVQILSYSMGCHLAVRAANLIRQQRQPGRSRQGLQVEALFLIVPDPKYRVCPEDEIDNMKGNDSAYEQCCALWELTHPSGQDSPGKLFEKELCRLAAPKSARPKTEIHLVASKLDTVAEWRDNTERLYKATASEPGVHWWFPAGERGKHNPHGPPNHKIRVSLAPLKCQSLSETWIHESLDCTIDANAAGSSTKGSLEIGTASTRGAGSKGE